jgi:hypothetical protein
MKIKKFFFSNLLVGFVLGLILSPFIWIIWNAITPNPLDLYTLILIVTPVTMLSMVIILRERQK